jgi:flagellin
MPNTVGGISIATNQLANQALLNLNRNQQSLGKLVNQLSSGLRVNTAADDPSGLAIAVNLNDQSAGFDTANLNVQDATNAANVADGALSTVTSILQRVRSLAIEASNTITSPTDRAALQDEVTQLLQEIN